jgi:hypothetical protein
MPPLFFYTQRRLRRLLLILVQSAVAAALWIFEHKFVSKPKIGVLSRAKTLARDRSRLFLLWATNPMHGSDGGVQS